uniref:Uncharacterized protein n=1 Tax=Anguilla anguilla TaxID=7936 RepID=A0A0E9S002_ANGAN
MTLAPRTLKWSPTDAVGNGGRRQARYYCTEYKCLSGMSHMHHDMHYISNSS